MHVSPTVANLIPSMCVWDNLLATLIFLIFIKDLRASRNASQGDKCCNRPESARKVKAEAFGTLTAIIKAEDKFIGILEHDKRIIFKSVRIKMRKTKESKNVFGPRSSCHDQPRSDAWPTWAPDTD